MTELQQLLLEVVSTDFDRFKQLFNFHFNVNKYVQFSSKQKTDKILNEKFSDILSSDAEYVSGKKQQLLKALHLSPEIDYDINHPLLNFALLPFEILTKILLYIGAVVYSKQIAKVVEKQQREEVIDCIGEDVYNFVLRRAMVLQKRIPDVAIEKKSKLCENIKKTGDKIFAIAMSGLPKNAINRLNLKFEHKLTIPETSEEQLQQQSLDLIYYIIGTAMSENQEAQQCLL